MSQNDGVLLELLKLLRIYDACGISLLYENKSTVIRKVATPIPTLFTNLRSAIEEAYRIASACNTIEELTYALKAFDGCELKNTALNTVIGDGNIKSDILFIGEAPGASEDMQGIPFCGQSGLLLNNILAAVGLSRAQVYITNAVFWRPPGNRKPTKYEIEVCSPFVAKHIQIVSPKLIIMVGATAVESLLKITTPIGQMRGKYFHYLNEYLSVPIKATPIFHPSYLLRQPRQKKLMWFDMLKIISDLKASKALELQGSE